MQGLHCFSRELSLECRALGTREKYLHSKVLKKSTNLVLVVVRGSTRPGIKGLAFGFYGEWSREVGDFIAEVHRSNVTWIYVAVCNVSGAPPLQWLEQ